LSEADIGLKAFLNQLKTATTRVPLCRTLNKTRPHTHICK